MSNTGDNYFFFPQVIFFLFFFLFHSVCLSGDPFLCTPRENASVYITYIHVGICAASLLWRKFTDLQFNLKCYFTDPSLCYLIKINYPSLSSVYWLPEASLCGFKLKNSNYYFSETAIVSEQVFKKVFKKILCWFCSLALVFDIRKLRNTSCTSITRAQAVEDEELMKMKLWRRIAVCKQHV